MRADEADHGVGEERLEVPGDAVGARLERLLVHAAVRAGRQGAALSRLEVHDVVAQRAAFERQRRRARFREQGKRDAEAVVGPLRPGDRLKDQVHRDAVFDGADLVRDVRQHARCVGISSRWITSITATTARRPAARRPQD